MVLICLFFIWFAMDQFNPCVVDLKREKLVFLSIKGNYFDNKKRFRKKCVIRSANLLAHQIKLTIPMEYYLYIYIIFRKIYLVISHTHIIANGIVMQR